jgi:hypothetical protein
MNLPSTSIQVLVFPPLSVIIALMMEAARTSETLVNFYQTTQCNNPEDSHLHTCGHENLKSNFLLMNGKIDSGMKVEEIGFISPKSK